MSTLEKFGILVILILVVIIGVVAVWGVGGEKDNPFAPQDPAGENVAAGDPSAPPAAELPGWTNGAPPAASGTVPVPPPGIGSTPTPANGGSSVLSVPAPADAGATTYTVQKGDTGAKIAKQTLGDANKWKLIAAINNNKDARKLKIGEVLKIPAAGGTSVADTGLKAPVPSKSLLPELQKVAPNPADGPTETKAAPAPVPEAGGREVEVRSGDTLYEIARRELGDPNLYYKIIKANPGLDPKKIRPGMKIKLPAL